MDNVKYSTVKTSSDTVKIFEGAKEVFLLDKITYLSDLSNIEFYVVCSDLGRPVIYGVNKGFRLPDPADIFDKPTSKISVAMAGSDDLVLWEHIKVIEVFSDDSTLRLGTSAYTRDRGILTMTSDDIKMDLFGAKVKFSLTDTAGSIPWVDELMSTLLWIAVAGFYHERKVYRGLIDVIDSTEGIRWECYPTLKLMYDKFKGIVGTTK